MKNNVPNHENNAILTSCNFSETLVQSKGGQRLLESSNNSFYNCDILHQDNYSTTSIMGHKGRFYYRVLAKRDVKQESRSQSVPNSLNTNKFNGNSKDSCDSQLKLSFEDECSYSSSQDFWFNTWPERNEKSKNADVEDDVSTVNDTSCSCNKSKVNNSGVHIRAENSNKSVNKILSLNETLNSISLAYSPLTKQLHLISEKDTTNKIEIDDNSVTSATDANLESSKDNQCKSEVDSFSCVSDSSSSYFLNEDERTFPCAENNVKSKKIGLSAFFSRNVFSWRTVPSSTINSWNIFQKNPSECLGSSKHENIVASSSALIQHERPPCLPAKDEEEEQRHRDEYKAMLTAAKKREAKNSVAKHKQQKLQLKVEDRVASAARYWNTTVLPKWDTMYKTKKTQDMWWQGLPSSVRGKIWRLAIGNDLNLTQQLYEICLSRAQSQLNTNSCDSDTVNVGKDMIDQENGLDVIKLDIARTFPNLCIFQEGGPYSNILHSLLAAYVCYRPDVGYVQGMSFIAAILILNMELFDAFICFANLLNRPLHLAAYTLNQKQMQAYYGAYNELFSYNLPKLYAHFKKSGLTPDLYLLDWVYTVFAKAMPLDIACRVWDVFLRDGDEFIFRTALGVLHLYQDILMHMDFLHGAQFLTRLPDDLSAENLFRSIQIIYVFIGKLTFSQIVENCKENL